MKMLFRLTFIISVIFSGTIFAQDTIYYKASGKAPEIVNITSYDWQYIHFKRPEIPDGPEFIIKRSTINYIVLSDGKFIGPVDLEHVRKAETERRRIKNEKKSQRTPWYTGEYGFNFLVTDLFFKKLTFSAQRTILNNHLGFRFTYSAGLKIWGEPDSASALHTGPYNNYTGYYGEREPFPYAPYYNENKNYSYAFELFYLSNPENDISFYTGVMFQLGKFYSLTPNFIYNNSNSYFELKPSFEEYQGLMARGGIEYKLGSMFYVGANAGIGIYSTAFYVFRTDVIPLDADDTKLGYEGYLSTGIRF